MQKSPIIFSILANPFPIFIEGNIETYKQKKNHPKRNNLGYFDLIFVTNGTLYLEENTIQYEVQKNEMILLAPNHLHFSYQPSDANTTFYWLHFYTETDWAEANNPIFLNPTFKIPQLHFHNKVYTLHIPKHQIVTNIAFTIDTLKKILTNTKENDDFIFFENQKLFIDLLKQLEMKRDKLNTSQELAQNMKDYLNKNISKTITSDIISKEFHFHYNYLARIMKKYYSATPIVYLNELRLIYSADLLLHTNLAIQVIAEKSGFQTVPYFSNCFKKKYTISPNNFRKSYSSY